MTIIKLLSMLACVLFSHFTVAEHPNINNPNPFEKFWDTAANDLAGEKLDFPIADPDGDFSSLSDYSKSQIESVIGRFGNFFSSNALADYETKSVLTNARANEILNNILSQGEGEYFRRKKRESEVKDAIEIPVSKKIEFQTRSGIINAPDGSVMPQISSILDQFIKNPSQGEMVAEMINKLTTESPSDALKVTDPSQNPRFYQRSLGNSSYRSYTNPQDYLPQNNDLESYNPQNYMPKNTDPQFYNPQTYMPQNNQPYYNPQSYNPQNYIPQKDQTYYNLQSKDKYLNQYEQIQGFVSPPMQQGNDPSPPASPVFQAEYNSNNADPILAPLPSATPAFHFDYNNHYADVLGKN